jgi:hypothetical protein
VAVYTRNNPTASNPIVKNNRNLNTWLLLFALAVMVNRVLTPFSVPPLVVHDNGYIEICSWHGGISRVLLDADGNPVESEQAFSHCPQCVAGTATSLPERPHLAEQSLAVQSAITLLDINPFPHPAYAVLPPPSRAPPLS